MVADIDVVEFCPKCDEEAIRIRFPKRTYLNGTKVTHAEYNPGLGCVVKNKRHKEDLCKERNLVEVGNDYGDGEKMQTDYDNSRADKHAQGWKDVCEEVGIPDDDYGMEADD